MSKEDQKTTERLNEVILDLERSKDKEQDLREESNGLLKALGALISSSDENEVFNRLLKSLQEVLGYHHAFIIIKEDDQFELKYTTKQQFINTIWEEGEFFKRVLIGKTLAAFNVEKIPEWAVQPNHITQHVTSALHIPLTGKTKKAILICTHKEKGYFSQKHQALALKFVPIATQALILLETNQDLKEEIDERKKVELELIKVQSQLVKKAYTEGFAENAIDVLHSIGNALTPLLIHAQELKKDTTLNSVLKFIEMFKTLISDHHEKKTLVEYFSDENNCNKVVKSLNVLSDQLDNYTNKRADGFEKIITHVNKIHQTVDAQQKFAELKDDTDYETNIIKVLRDIIEYEGMIAESSQVDIQFQSSLDSIYVNAESNSFHHAIVNLINNAIESFSSEQTDRKIIIIADQDDMHAKISIKDNGQGYTSYTQEELFRFGFTTKEDRAGFGLHNTANFIKSCHGSTEISSQGIGKGTIVIVTLPVLLTKG